MKITASVIRRFVGFTLCNLPGTAVELLVVWLCAKYLFNGYVGEYIVSPIVAFECAVFTNYVLYTRFVWGDRVRGASLRERFLRLLAYNVSASGVYFLRMLVIQFLGITWHMPVVLCEVISLLFSGFLNFFAIDKLIFRRKTQGWFGLEKLFKHKQVE